MKTEIKLTADAIITLDRFLQRVYESVVTSKESRITLSIAFDVAEKVGTKARGLIKKQSLFDTKKKHKISFKYHEAWALEQIIRSMPEPFNNVYQNSMLTNIANIINQKLA